VTFSITISVPVTIDGWSGMDHLPTIQMETPLQSDMEVRMGDILRHLPQGTTFHAVAI